MQQTYRSLTGIRAIAASMVFLYHNRKYWRGWLPDFIIQNLNEYHTGVSLFFVLSGFLIAYTYADKPLQSKKEYLKYLVVRLCRIFPGYLIILTISYLDNGFPDVAKAFYNYTLLKGFSDKYNLEGLPQSWTLTVELCFYTIAPILYWQASRNWRKTGFLLLLLCACSMGIGYGWHWINGNTGRWLYNWLFIFNGTFFGRFAEFYCGLLLAMYLKRKIGTGVVPVTKYLTAISLLVCMILIYLISFFEMDMYDHGTEHIPGLIIRNLILPVGICVFLYSLITEKTWVSYILSTRLFVLLGNASYIFYLIHIGYINRKLVEIHLFPDRNFILLWIISIVGFFLLEKPVYTLARKPIQRW